MNTLSLGGKVAVGIIGIALASMVAFATAYVSIGTNEVSTVNAGSVDYYLKIEGIPGEATDSEHKDWVIIESMSSPIFRSVPSSSSGATYEPIVIRKRIDKASPKLLESIAKGEVIPSATLEVVHPTRKGDYYKITFKDLIISSLNTEGEAGDVPTEEVAFYYNKIHVEYTTKTGETESFGWDNTTHIPWEPSTR